MGETVTGGWEAGPQAEAPAAGAARGSRRRGGWVAAGLVVVLVGCWTLAMGVIVSESRVTATVRASARPCRVTPAVTVIDAWARMFPWRME